MEWGWKGTKFKRAIFTFYGPPIITYAIISLKITQIGKVGWDGKICQNKKVCLIGSCDVSRRARIVERVSKFKVLNDKGQKGPSSVAA